ncbi:hypothetical protein DFH94DRAFT_697213 [Russula ochroleuca]|jgi:uncharacterized membrane protein YagU involved in acid resistance|uniref:Uncharacterized protein n=1 Tax=Russula ochroleuca TaxID=152965 RepID=A0A9P5JYV3_9AGAM|nr:hypothetical protein DFH94DRAFT_697213 [Russula ochroleuca]
MYRRTNIAYELPSTVKALNDGWLATYQISTVVAALFVVVEVHLLTFVKDASNYPKEADKSARHALLIFTYSALFFCLGATISGLILTDQFGELPVRASRKKDPIQQGVFDSGALDLLRTYGAKRSWIWVMWHWLFSLVAGTISLITQVLLYVWVEESNSVRITLTFISLFAVLPLLHLVPRPQGSGKLSPHGIMNS